jgi:hypothetical protein
MRLNNLKQMKIAKALNREIIHKILIIYLQIQKKRVLNKEIKRNMLSTANKEKKKYKI